MVDCLDTQSSFSILGDSTKFPHFSRSHKNYNDLVAEFIGLSNQPIHIISLICKININHKND